MNFTHHHSPSVLGPAAVGLALLASSATLAAESKTGWMEVQTPHITLKTDLRQDDAWRAVALAEQTRAALLAAAWPGATLPQERVELVVFSDHNDFKRYFGELISVKVVLGSDPPTIFLYDKPERWEKRAAVSDQSGFATGQKYTTSVLKQALAQHLATFFYRRQPKWFAIGLSQFLETLSLSEDGKTATLGQINPVAMGDYTAYRTLTVADALAWGRTYNPRDEGTVLGLYGLSWLMVQWMYNTHQGDFVRFQKLLSSGMDPDKAWKVVFPTLTTTDLDHELNHFAKYTQTGLLSVPIPEFTATVDRERPMSSADIHVVRAQAELAAEHPKQALSELTAALADDPANVAALRRQMPLAKPAERLAMARRAVAAHPDDGLAWLMLGDALGTADGTSEERMQAYRKATELAPDHPAAFAALAAMDVQQGHPQEAFPLATTAVRMAPLEPAYLDTLAAALSAMGRCSEAVAIEARALEKVADDSTLSEEARTAARAQYTAHLADIQKTCVEAPQAPASAAPAAPEPVAPKP